MKKADLSKLIGRQVIVTMADDDVLKGKLEYVNDFSYKSGYRKPGYFYIGHCGFKVSHIKKCVEV